MVILQADSLPKLVDLVWGLAATCYFYIHRMNWVISCNDLFSTLPLWHSQDFEFGLQWVHNFFPFWAFFVDMIFLGNQGLDHRTTMSAPCVCHYKSRSKLYRHSWLFVTDGPMCCPCYRTFSRLLWILLHTRASA